MWRSLLLFADIIGKSNKGMFISDTMCVLPIVPNFFFFFFFFLGFFHMVYFHEWLSMKGDILSYISAMFDLLSANMFTALYRLATFSFFCFPMTNKRLVHLFGYGRKEIACFFRLFFVFRKKKKIF